MVASTALTKGQVINPLKLERADFVCLLGLAPVCAMLRPPFFGSLMTSAIEGFSAMRVAYDSTLVLFGLLFMLLSLGRLIPRFCERVSGALLFGAVAAVGALGINFGRALGLASPPFFFCCVFFVGLGLAGLLLSWFRRLLDYSRDRVSFLVLGAFVASHVFGLLDVLPRGIASLVSALYPLLSASALVVGWNRFSEDEALLGEDRHEGNLAYENPRFSKMRNLALVLIVVEITCGALLRSRWAHGGVDYTPAPNTIFTYLVSALIGAVFMFVVSKARFGADGALGIGAIGMVGFALSTALFSLVSMRLLSSFVTGLYSALLVFMMALLLLRGLDGDKPPAFSAGLFLVLYGFVTGITTTAIPFLLSYQGLMPDEHLAVVGAAAGLVVSLGVGASLFVMVVIQRDSYLEALDLAGAAQGEYLSGTVDGRSALSAHDEAVAYIADEYGLTARERETASFISRGYSVKRSAEEMCLAPATVQGYSKSLYRKLGIHKKDELIEMIDAVGRLS